MGAFGGCWPHWSGFRFFNLVMRKSHLHIFHLEARNQTPKVCHHVCDSIPIYQNLDKVFKVYGICPSCLSTKPKLQQTFKVWDKYHQPVLFFLPVCISESALTPMSLCLDMSKLLNTWMNTQPLAQITSQSPYYLPKRTWSPTRGPCRRSAKTSKNLPGKKQSCVVHRGAAMLRLLRFCFCLPLTFSEELDFEQAPLRLLGLWLKSVEGFQVSKFRRTW